jgi:hypothetical protein
MDPAAPQDSPDDARLLGDAADRLRKIAGDLRRDAAAYPPLADEGKALVSETVAAVERLLAELQEIQRQGGSASPSHSE